MIEKFRPCAGAIVFNKNSQVLLCSRNDTRSDAWQFPQGGIEKDEKPEEAAKRELFEETSIASVVLVCTDEKPQRYEFTSEIKNKFKQRGILCDGQDIYFSLFYFCGEEDEINVKTAQPEFNKYKWSDFDFAVKNVITFKKDVYLTATEKFAPIIRQYLEKLS